MKHERFNFRGRGVLATLAAVLFAGLPFFADAQITGGNRGAGTTTGYSATGAGNGGYTRSTTSVSNGGNTAQIRRGELQNAAIVNTGYIDGTSLVSTDMRDADLWARAIIHADGSYTETKKDDANAQMLTQRTLSANGVLLQERTIMADDSGFPSEVLIKDAAGNFKYRGVLVYDRNGRFMEEQLYNMNNQLLRRKIQEYGPKGEPKLRVVEYVKNLPADIQLVITEENSGRNAEQAQRNLARFQRNAQERDVDAEPKEKKGFFKKLNIFGRKKKN